MVAAIAVQGYWEPHTSSIDFCEANYRFTPYVAELLNSVSSLPIALCGAWAWAYTPRPYSAWPRFVLCWLAFIAIGLGSAAFHGTLRRTAQAFDEVPMVVANLVFVFCLLRPSEVHSRKLASGLGVAALILVVGYVIYEAYAVFVFMYGTVVVYSLVESWRRAFSYVASASPNASVLRKLWYYGISTYGVGFVLWVTDHVVCAQLGVGHLHILWHAFGCMGTLIFVLLLLGLTADADGFQVQLRWLRCLQLPIMPFLELSKDGGNTNGHSDSSKKVS